MRFMLARKIMALDHMFIFYKREGVSYEKSTPKETI